MSSAAASVAATLAAGYGDHTPAAERLLTVLKQIITWHEKWKAAQSRGTSLCQSVEAIKRRAFDQKEKDKNISLYPDDLKSVCDNLAIVMTIFEDAISAVALFEKQIIALNAQLEGAQRTTTGSAAVFKTWTANEILGCVSSIHNMFRHEYEIKMKVTENIAHANSKEEAVWHAAIWSYPAYANVELDLKVTSLSVEIS